MPEPGLRERKKQQVRLQISHAATTLIIERGFDAVSVTEIAERAGVSRMTVFNYFPRKEDMFYDRVPLIRDLITAAVRNRPESQTPQTALRDLALKIADPDHPLPGYPDQLLAFWQVAADSPALRARAREIAEETESLVTDLLTEAGAPAPRMTAALMAAAFRVCLRDAAHALAAGTLSLPELRARLTHTLDAAAAAGRHSEPELLLDPEPPHR
ncbi:TetR/AcrR family transcriptional regulator [Actinoplanes sp. LDG1-06]|uniref:TetR/AcrR family transcriptional regulator n=1 Tax=Paractinoplanes ovalisporus TaxID=2810368 RepID=A0ABS2AGA6_9ACTN|nr:TetR/AcrR family transcriptional regulator [Actinoplanes ovalisporus]MBM2618843.1 TetR/AcrR family transcriptional regulator [Actinoplanes ovalisporus]